MVTKTIGVGGDYADIGAAWDALKLVGTLLDNYTFYIISDFTEATGASGGPIFNGKTVTFTDITRNYLITTAVGYAFIPGGGGASIADVLVLDGLKIHYTAVTTINLLTTYPMFGTNAMKVYYKNLNLRGVGWGYAIRNYTRWGNHDYILNCKVCNFGTGIDFNGLTDASTTGHEHIVENCSVYQCTVGYCLPQSGGDNWAQFKNCVAINCSLKDFNNPIGGPYPGVLNTITNCADEDNSIATSGAVLSNNITGITAADFKSIDPTSSDFLKLNQTPILQPITPGSIGETVSFSTDITSTSKLWKTGTVSISAWNTEDLAGNQRPNNDGSVCIGAYEKGEITSYAWDLDDGKTSTEANPITTYSIPGTKDISVTITFTDGATSTLTGTVDITAYTLDFSADTRSGPVKLKTKFSVIFEP